MKIYDRRNYLKKSVMGAVAATCIRPFDLIVASVPQQQYSSRVSLTSGDNRADLVFSALQPFSKEIAMGIGKRRMVASDRVVAELSGKPCK